MTSPATTMHLPGEITVPGGQRLAGTLRMPGDKSVSHRALILGALAEGTTIISGLSDGDDVARTKEAVRALGAAVSEVSGEVRVEGGRRRLRAPAAPLDCGNSGTGMRLLAGMVAGLPGTTVLVGDDSLSARPMDRVARPLVEMGAQVTGSGDRCLPPISVTGGALRGIEWRSPIASAQVKSAILLAALNAAGSTRLIEPTPTRAHTEELLEQFGATISVTGTDEGTLIEIQPSQLVASPVTVPGDPSQAAFWVVAGCVLPGSSVTVEDVYAGATRTGFVDVLLRMGAQISMDTGPDHLASIRAAAGPLHATIVHAHEIPSLDEVPILAVAAAAAQGVTTFLGMGELRVKEVDRLDAVRDLVNSFGAAARIEGDDLYIEGLGDIGGFRACTFDSRGDHRMAMAAAVAALGAEGTSVITRFESVETSYPQFLAHLHDLGASYGQPDHVVGRRGHQDLLIAIDGPAGSGKSTLSRAIAERLGVARLDTGAMYRSVAWACLQAGIDPTDAGAVAGVARAAVIGLEGDTVTMNGTDVTSAIRSPQVSAAVSVVAANPEVRREMVARQRDWARAHGGGVVEGRDIGSVVFPSATIKVFLTADIDERRRRRADEAPESVSRRDEIDSTRTASPLALADGARVLDTTDRSVEDVVEEVLSWL